MKLSRFLCFTGDSLPQCGNIAIVVEKFTGQERDKQNLAATLNCPVTVFIENSEAAIPRLRFFYPALEMELCAHGILAGAFLLMQRRKVNRLKVVTQNGKIISLQRQANLVKLALDKIPHLIFDITLADTLLMLRCKAEQIDPNLPLVVASIGSPKLLIPLRERQTLDALQPNFELIKAWSKTTNINGLYVYTPDTDREIDFAARGFNPKGGLNEDPATGVAAGALISALALTPQTDFIIDQGESMGKPCRLYLTRQEETILVGGRVVFQAEAH